MVIFFLVSRCLSVSVKCSVSTGALQFLVLRRKSIIPCSSSLYCLGWRWQNRKPMPTLTLNLVTTWTSVVAPGEKLTPLLILSLKRRPILATCTVWAHRFWDWDGLTTTVMGCDHLSSATAMAYPMATVMGSLTIGMATTEPIGEWMDGAGPCREDGQLTE